MPLQGSKLSNFKTSSVSKQFSVTKIQIFSFREAKCSSVWSHQRSISIFWQKRTFNHLRRTEFHSKTTLKSNLHQVNILQLTEKLIFCKMHWGKGCASFLLPFYSEVLLSFCYNSYYVIFNTGKSLSEALIYASINRLFMNYHENYKCRTWAEQYLNNFEKPSHKVNCDIYRYENKFIKLV